MTPTHEQRVEAYLDGGDVVQHLYGAPESGEKMYRFFAESGLPDEQYAAYGTVVGDVILGFYLKSQLPKLFASKLNVPLEKAEEMAKRLDEFLRPIPHNSSGSHEAIKRGPDQSEVAASQQHQTPITREEILRSLNPKRTMADDIERVTATPPPQQKDAGAEWPYRKGDDVAGRTATDDLERRSSGAQE